MAKRVGVDKWLFGTVLLLVLFGLVMVFSASAVMAQEDRGSPYAYLAKQALWVALGMVALFALMQVDYKRYNNYPVVAAAVGLTTMLDVYKRQGWGRRSCFPLGTISKWILSLLGWRS